MKKPAIRAALRRLNERLDNQWRFAQICNQNIIDADLVMYNDDGERIPIEPEISYHGMIAAFETLGGEWRRDVNGKHWLCLDGIVASTQKKEA